MSAAFPFDWHYSRLSGDTGVLVRGRRCDQNYEDENWQELLLCLNACCDFQVKNILSEIYFK